ncbi:MAG: penicillin-binding protein 2 [Nitrospirota bacterium]|nr:penicillin-binding protein 2 [Nitrospirota bacterium]MDH5296238.1 penicillin-binding protein 2 [Nitrospirota bacterium]
MKTPSPDIHPVCRMRSGIVCLGLLLGFVVIGCRLFYLQVIQAEVGAHQAQQQHQKTVVVQPDRGVIVDRHGHPLALNVEVASLYVRPPSLKDPHRTARSLAPVLEMPATQLGDLFTRNQPFVWVKRNVPESIAKKLEAMNIPGLGLTREPHRFYPKGELVSHIVGFAGIDSQGLEGVELQYESYLRGEKNLIKYQRDALGRKIASPQNQDSANLPTGYHLTLTVDEVIQFIAEEELAQAMKRSGAKSGSIVIMDPLTGAILAWALHPTFDPNHLGQFSAQDWRNRAVTDPYEPGSTLKIVVAAAALEEHVMAPDTLIYGGEGQMAVAGTIVHDPAKTSWMTFSEAVAQSSNVGAIKVAMELGQDRVFAYLKAFGFGEKTEIDLPGESSGILRELNKWSGRSLSSIAMGQEIGVTPIQMVAAMSAVANGGWLMTPYVVSSVLDSQGQAMLTKDPQPKRRPISTETAGVLTRILETAVETGTGKRAKLAEYRAAGKTGTAQKIDVETGSYSSSRVIASFVGFAPIDQPRLTMLVVIDEPKIGNWGGEIAAPVFRKVAERVLPHLGVLPGGSPIIRTAAATQPISSPQPLVQ